MKKLTKRMSVIALCIVMLVMAVVPAFAAESASENPLVASDYTGPIEDHSIIDCTNRYRMDDGKYNFTIKLPHGTDLYNVTMEITRNDEGSKLFSDRLFYFSVPGVFGTSVTLSYSYDGSDYYEFICHQFSTEGVGIKLFMTYDGVSYMATDAPNGSTTEGRGYWLSA